MTIVMVTAMRIAKKQWILIGKTTNSVYASRPFVHFFAVAAQLHDNVKVPNFTFLSRT